MGELIQRVRSIAAEIDEVHGTGTAARDAAGTFAVLAAGCGFAMALFIATGG